MDPKISKQTVKNTYFNWTVGVSSIAGVLGCLHYDGPLVHWPAVFVANFIGTALLLAIGYIAVRHENRRRL